jgi:hypothetical protein
MDPANLKRLTVGALSALTLLLPLPAAARFGKAGSSPRASRSAVHPSSPVPPSRPYIAPGGGGAPRYYRPPGVWRGHYGWYGYEAYPAVVPIYEPYYPYPYPPPYPYPYPPPPVVDGPPSVSLSLAADGVLSYRGGAGAFGLGLAVDAHRFGVNAQFTSIYLPVDDGGFGWHGHDNIGLFNLFATYSLVASRDARLRLEAGLMSAFAPDLVTAGPGFGLSLVIGEAGPVGLEGTVHATPYPFRELDGGLGLVLRAGPVGIRGGWRRIWLDDRGLVDHISHQDVFSGPYFGLQFAM